MHPDRWQQNSNTKNAEHFFNTVTSVVVFQLNTDRSENLQRCRLKTKTAISGAIPRWLFSESYPAGI